MGAASVVMGAAIVVMGAAIVVMGAGKGARSIASKPASSAGNVSEDCCVAWLKKNMPCSSWHSNQLPGSSRKVCAAPAAGAGAAIIMGAAIGAATAPMPPLATMSSAGNVSEDC